ncbi:CRE-PHAT-2 protein [Caenorhabditis remanei]|uniref:CRE-PHAT-2 protein n=1 Tax=Caenorhabditis remanei TaxID=31234 RepID=E3MX75_CAERE|nr:CRE-PHAT-2 protein [Caenorhabditis remanei]
MLQSVFLIGSLVAIAFGQTCDPLKILAPCGDGLPDCETGQTCDIAQSSCCLNADLITTTVAGVDATATASSTTTVFGNTVTSRTVTSSTGCVDRVNAATGTSDCAARRNLCNDATYYDVMTQQCPKTCGRCSSISTTPATGTCVDLKNPRTGSSDCASMRAYCNDSNYIALMRVQCPRTCGFCGSSSSTSSSTLRTGSSTISSGSSYFIPKSIKNPSKSYKIYTIRLVKKSCVDQVNPSTGRSECAANIGLCNNSAYQTIMRTQCPRTCGFCTSG